MNELKLGKILITNRHKNGMTQDQLANYIGVSKSSVSKWETGFSYPDIVLLPQIATLFNITVDQLMGYEPQMSDETIARFYHHMAEEFASKPQKTLDECEETIKKYYACFPFLYQMAILYLNHHVVFEDKNFLLDKSLVLCKRIELECDDSVLVKDTLSLQAIIYMMMSKPEEVLQLLGEKAKPLSQDVEMIAASFQLLGNQNKANEILQVCIYQHLLYLIQNSVNLMVQNHHDIAFCEETMHRLMVIVEAYHIDQLHLNTAMMFYLSAAYIYVMQQNKEHALAMVERYTAVIMQSKLPYDFLRGDDYFTKILPWLEELKLGTQAPRSAKLMKEMIVSGLLDNPAFGQLQEEFRFKNCIEKLKTL